MYRVDGIPARQIGGYICPYPKLISRLNQQINSVRTFPTIPRNIKKPAEAGCINIVMLSPITGQAFGYNNLFDI